MKPIGLSITVWIHIYYVTTAQSRRVVEGVRFRAQAMKRPANICAIKFIIARNLCRASVWQFICFARLFARIINFHDNIQVKNCQIDNSILKRLVLPQRVSHCCHRVVQLLFTLNHFYLLSYLFLIILATLATATTWYESGLK